MPQGLGFADVFIDGEGTPRGRIPRQEPFELTPGAHRIRLERSGEVVGGLEVTVKPDETVRLPVPLEAR